MKQLTIISGKGGTGKTTLTAAFASLARDVVLADCDVDAADLHLILKPEIEETIEFTGLKLAVKDAEKCTSCGECLEHCRFGAVSEDLEIIEESCEGCGVCGHVCPEGAIELVDRKSGLAFRSKTRVGPMAHAELKTAEEASGLLVALVRKTAKELAEAHGKGLVLVDGPPGIGCPVIAAIAGVDLVLIITEPTLSGIHDLERILGVAEHFEIPALVCINKADINPENAARIEDFCEERSIPVVGKLPYDTVVTEAMIAEKSVVEFSDCALSREVERIWKEIEGHLS